MFDFDRCIILYVLTTCNTTILLKFPTTEVSNAPINVFPQRGEGGHRGAIDIDVLPVSGASEQLLTQGSPQGPDY